MKTLEQNKVAVIKNGHTAEEMREIEEEFIKREPLKYTIEDLIKLSLRRKQRRNLPQ